MENESKRRIQEKCQLKFLTKDQQILKETGGQKRIWIYRKRYLTLHDDPGQRPYNCTFTAEVIHRHIREDGKVISRVFTGAKKTVSKYYIQKHFPPVTEECTQGNAKDHKLISRYKYLMQIVSYKCNIQHTFTVLVIRGCKYI